MSHTYTILQISNIFPHLFGCSIKTTTKTDLEAIDYLLTLWQEHKISITCLEYFLDLVAPEFLKECYNKPFGEEAKDNSSLSNMNIDISETILTSPWNPLYIPPALMTKIIEKIKSIITKSLDYKKIFLRMLETSPVQILLIKPGDITHMDSLLEKIQGLCFHNYSHI